MSSSPLADACWALIVADTGARRGRFLFMSGLTRVLLTRQREQAALPDYLYGVRIMIDDAMPVGEIRLGPFRQEPS